MKRSVFSAFCSDRSGNFGIIFALAILPLMVAVGFAIDFTRAADAKSKLDAALDAAVLYASEAVSVTGADPNAIQAQAQVYFMATLGTVPFITVNSITIALPASAQAGVPIAVTGVYSAQINTSFGLSGNYSIAVNGQSTAASQTPLYYQIIFLVDNSGSMAIGGTDNDVQALMARNAGCGFACHNPNHYPTADGANDFSAEAAAANPPILLKFDYARLAIGDFMASLQPMMLQYPNNFSIGIRTFATADPEVLAPTTNLAAIGAAIAGLSLEAATQGAQNYGYTYLNAALGDVQANLENAGDGSSPSRRKTFVILITDGVEDLPFNIVYLPQSTLLLRYGTCDYGTNRCTTTYYSPMCSSLKASDSNLTLFTIQAAYPVVPNSDPYTQLVQPLQNLITPSMQACASSPAFAYVATDGPGIETAVMKVFSTIGFLSRLTN
jgi:Flp pilus assembly protein TadG